MELVVKEVKLEAWKDEARKDEAELDAGTEARKEAKKEAKKEAGEGVQAMAVGKEAGVGVQALAEMEANEHQISETRIAYAFASVPVFGLVLNGAYSYASTPCPVQKAPSVRYGPYSGLYGYLLMK